MALVASSYPFLNIFWTILIFFAWVAWLLIHVMLLIGFRNRFLVMFDWALSYLTYERNSRLITGDPKQLFDAEAPGSSHRTDSRPLPPT